MAEAHDPDADLPLRNDEDLEAIFHGAEKPRSEWRVGAEAEKFGVDARTGAPLPYEGERSVLRIFSTLIDQHGWRPESEVPGGPVLALLRGDSSITLEPGAQLELSGAPLDDVHSICAEMRGHLGEIAEITKELGLAWLGVGFHPFARQADLPWVPKQRYRVMREYLPKRGPAAHDMMRRTATVQANLDYDGEEDALRKLVVGLRLGPLLNAMLANSPFIEGRVSGKKSLRGEVWLGMDPDRSGLIPALWSTGRPRYRHYVEWALDCPMFLFKRSGVPIENTGQPFRAFMKEGFAGHRATRGDWAMHLQTLFPEMRLKKTLELRCCDSLPQNLACAIPALGVGLLYDEAALSRAEALARTLSLEDVMAARRPLVERGLGASIGARSAQALAEEILDIAEAGLERRARLSPSGKDERIHLRRLKALVEHGRSPADLLTDGLDATAADATRQILERTLV